MGPEQLRERAARGCNWFDAGDVELHGPRALSGEEGATARHHHGNGDNAHRQFSVGRSMWSMTTTSTVPRLGSSFSPSCSGNAVVR